LGKSLQSQQSEDEFDRPKFVAGKVRFWGLIWLIKIISGPLFRIKVSGKDKYPPGAFVGVFNHSSNLDAIIMAWSVIRPNSFMAKIELEKIPLIGWLLKGAGAIFVRRGGNDQEAFDEALARLKDGLPVFLAPEGTRHQNGSDKRKVHTGFIRLAQLAKVPVVPVAVVGACEAMPPGAIFPRPNKLHSVISDPIRLEELEVSVENHLALSAQATAVMESVYLIKDEFTRELDDCEK
jgi:1-acyl-sn-glycerol-3-phosphate acyltransferase